jgi:hypothetical protein
MEANLKNQTLLITYTLILAIFLAALFCSPCHSDNLVQVDGVTPTCVVNQQHQVQHPGPGTLFPSPEYGYCNGSIQYKCATPNNVAMPGSTAYGVIGTACVGTFTSFADLQAQQAKGIDDLKQQIQQQLNILKANIKALSDANDALTKRLDDIETKKPAEQK